MPNGLADARNCNGRNVYGGLVNGYGLKSLQNGVELSANAVKPLNNSDYIIISSNRFYDSNARPVRYPHDPRIL
ncbi:MAG UNVERIFIED_CONTAM: hypothetical protein LVT10_14505 [Anaerolineae bacterium]